MLFSTALSFFFVGGSWLLLNIIAFATFHVPSESMSPTILPGDQIIVSKWDIGARIFNIFDAAKNKSTQIWRTPGLNRLHHGDIVIFNMPYITTIDSVAMNYRVYYIKRCIGLPDDTLSISDGRYIINGNPTRLHCSKSHISVLLSDSKVANLPLYPHFTGNDRTIANATPFWIPQKDKRIKLDTHHAMLYKKYIEWETGDQLTLNSDTIRLGDNTISSYKFRHNYYFMAGDNILNSNDSRYWGLVPEEFIVGKAWLIWKSVNPHTGNTRIERSLKQLK